MRTIVERANQAYSNLEIVGQTSNAATLHIYETEPGRRLYELLKRSLSVQDFWGPNYLAELQIFLYVCRIDLRAYLASDDNIAQYWSEKDSQLKQYIKALGSYFPDQLRDALNELSFNLCEDAVAANLEHRAYVLTQVSDDASSQLIVPENQRLARVYSEWTVSLEDGHRPQVMTSRQEISNLGEQDFEMLLFPSSPHYFFREPSYTRTFRTLLLGGFVKGFSFVSPRWAVTNTSPNYEARIFDGFQADLRALPTIGLQIYSSDVTKTLTEIDGQAETSDEILLPEFYRHVSVETLVVSGPVACRLFHLNDHLVYPVEEDAQRILVLSKDEFTDEWTITSQEPFGETKVGDILLASLDRSESDRIRSRAAELLGDRFSDYLYTQGLWKDKLTQMSERDDWQSLEALLTSNGVSKASRVRFWILPESIQPGLASDFEKLLTVLDFDRELRERILQNAKKYFAATIQAGREAATAILSNLESEHEDALLAGRNASIELAEYGGATFLLGPIIGIDDDVAKCEAHQVRRIVGYQRPNNEH